MIMSLSSFFRIGMIEWLENTSTLKEFILSTLTESEKKAYHGYEYVMHINSNSWKSLFFITFFFVIKTHACTLHRETEVNISFVSIFFIFPFQ